MVSKLFAIAVFENFTPHLEKGNYLRSLLVEFGNFRNYISYFVNYVHLRLAVWFQVDMAMF